MDAARAEERQRAGVPSLCLGPATHPEARSTVGLPLE